MTLWPCEHCGAEVTADEAIHGVARHGNTVDQALFCSHTCKEIWVFKKENPDALAYRRHDSDELLNIE